MISKILWWSALVTIALQPAHCQQQQPTNPSPNPLNITIVTISILVILLQAYLYRKQRPTVPPFPSTIFTEKDNEGATSASVQLPRKEKSIQEDEQISYENISPGIKKIMEEGESSDSKRKRRRKADRLSDRKGRGQQASFDNQQS